MRPKLITHEMETRFAKEAELRARRLPLHKRTPTKVLAAESGLAYGYVANVIAAKRREFESKVHVSCGTMGNVNS